MCDIFSLENVFVDYTDSRFHRNKRLHPWHGSINLTGIVIDVTRNENNPHATWNAHCLREIFSTYRRESFFNLLQIYFDLGDYGVLWFLNIRRCILLPALFLSTNVYVFILMVIYILNCCFTCASLPFIGIIFWNHMNNLTILYLFFPYPFLNFVYNCICYMWNLSYYFVFNLFQVNLRRR